MKKNEKGFSTVEILIVVVVLGLIGGVGWYLWQSKQATNQKTNSTKSQKVEQKPAANTSTNNTEASYLNVNEWGVKFKLEKSVERATYRFKETGNNWVYVSTPRLNELAEQTAQCSGAKESVTLNRAKVGDERFGSAWTEKDLQAIGTKLDEYYYFQEGGQSCLGSEAELAKVAPAVEEIGTIRAELNKLAKTVSKQ